ncbi:MAG TPA: bifunctional oligoribonuclease/PAP phosphatase NrnA [Ignavibacteriales bacterium]|nr:bifunctional oligoribonuclease/PAP phosphatase NrnA [Ignavibacteriales bacterium]
MIDFSYLAKIIRENHTFLITTHVNPDADAIGSEVAFYKILKQLGKTAYIVNHSAVPYNLTFLDTDNVIQKYDAEKHARLLNDVDVLAALDLNNPKRLVRMEDTFVNSTRTKICIDHHQNPAAFVNHFFVDADYSSTGQIIYDLINETGIVKLDYSTALPIYAAIMTDTGSFRFDRTTPAIHMIVARLLEAGVDPNYVYDQIYDQSHFGKIKLLGESLSSIRLAADNRIAYMVITREALDRSGAQEAEVDGFVNYCLSIRGVKIGMLFFELKDGIKVSFRSKGKIPVNLLAEEFGGGGHTNASGIRLAGAALNDHVAQIVEAAEKYLTVEQR